MAEQNDNADTSLQDVEKALSNAQKEREDAKDKLTTSEKNLEEVRGALNTLRAKERQLGKEAEKNRTNLEALKKEIAEKRREEREAKEAVRRARHNLAKKKWAVTKAAAAFNIKAIGVLLKFIIEACKNSPVSTVGAGYGSFTATGNAHQVAFSLSNDINSFKGAGLSDILLPISLLPLAAILVVSIVAALLLAALVCLPIPWCAERLAGFFQGAFKHTRLKAVLSIGFVIFSVLVSVGGVSSSPPEQIKDKVTIETVPPSELNGEYFRVNANSTYLFLQSLDPNDTAIKRVPVSQIAYITVNNGEREPGLASPVHALLERIKEEHEALRHGHAGYATVDHKHAGYITEELVRTRITEEMGCDGDEGTRISGFIRFNRGSENLDDFSASSKEIKRFVKERDQATKWMVFGFASPDGEQKGNNALAYKRAVAVKNFLCDELKPDCANGTEIEIKGFSEDHPVNGVANSRSARIAVCVDME